MRRVKRSAAPASAHWGQRIEACNRAISAQDFYAGEVLSSNFCPRALAPPRRDALYGGRQGPPLGVPGGNPSGRLRVGDHTNLHALVAQPDRASDFESEGREFESLRARHFGTKLGTPKPAVFALEAATSVRSSTLFEPMIRTSFASTST